MAEGVVLLLLLLADLLVAHRLGGFRLDLLVLGLRGHGHRVGFFFGVEAICCSTCGLGVWKYLPTFLMLESASMSVMVLRY